MENSTQNVLDFPKEVWTLVFEQFLDMPPNHLKNSRLSCKAFKNVIDSIPQRKFQQVLKIIYYSLDNRDRLNLRLVSKYCKAVIDLILENCLGAHRNLNAILQTFISSDDLRTFYASFKSSHSASHNPFPGRSFDIADNSYDEGENMDINILNESLPIMEYWGNHLKTMSIYTHHMLLPEVCDTVVQIFNAIPNIRRLKFIMSNCRAPDSVQLYPIAQELPKWPELKYLKKLTVWFEYFPWFRTCALNMVETYCKTLRNLTVNGSCNNRFPMPSNVPSLEFPTLTKLELVIRQQWLLDTIFEKWRMPRLTYLILETNFDDGKASGFYKTLKLVSAAVGKTLESLTVNNFVENMTIKKEHLNFPLLEELIVWDLYLDPTAVSNLPSLYSVSITHHSLEESTGIGSEDLYLDIMWDSCPSLEIIDMGKFRELRTYYRPEEQKQD